MFLIMQNKNGERDELSVYLSMAMGIPEMWVVGKNAHTIVEKSRTPSYHDCKAGMQASINSFPGKKNGRAAV